MAALTKAGESKRRKPSIIDKNNWSYVGNGGIKTTIYWSCSRRLQKKKIDISYKPWNGLRFLLKDLRQKYKVGVIQQIEIELSRAAK